MYLHIVLNHVIILLDKYVIVNKSIDIAGYYLEELYIIVWEERG